MKGKTQRLQDSQREKPNGYKRGERKNINAKERDTHQESVRQPEILEQQLVRTRETKMNNTKLNFCKNVLQELWEKFNGVEQYIKERIEDLCSESKLSVEELTYLFMNNYDNF